MTIVFREYTSYLYLNKLCWYNRNVLHTLIICISTSLSVAGPLKQLQIVSTIWSISLLFGSLKSGQFPRKWPYAINFWKRNKKETVKIKLKKKASQTFNEDLWFYIFVKDFTNLYTVQSNNNNFGRSWLTR